MDRIRVLHRQIVYHMNRETQHPSLISQTSELGHIKYDRHINKLWLYLPNHDSDDIIRPKKTNRVTSVRFSWIRIANAPHFSQNATQISICIANFCFITYRKIQYKGLRVVNLPKIATQISYTKSNPLLRVNTDLIRI